MNFIRLSWNSHLKSKKMYTIVKSRCNLVPEREFTRWMLILVTILLKCVLSASASSIDVSPSSSSSPPSMPTTNCSLVAHIFEGRGISTAEIPRKPINDKPLRYCESSINGSCCTPSMEIKLVSHTKQQLEKTTRDSISKLSSILSTRAVKFNEFFGQLLAESKKEFHLMFKRTYGVIYEENAYVFSDLFNELEKYYSRGKVDLAEAMDSFFNTLYQKMFTVLNSQYAFDDKYLGCVSEHMKELKPFGDVPDKLSVQIKRSFVATRTFAQALFTASDVAKKVMSIRPSENCTAALIKMQQCNVCKGYSEKPCANYCISVMKGCLSYYNELDIEWDNFVAAMDKVSERLIGPFNIVVVVEPINIKISEAIMNFQETGTVIANQVFQGCGRPNLGRPKREIIEPKTEYNKTTPPLESSGAYDTLDIDASLENEIIVIDRFRRSADISNDQQYKSSQSIDAAEQQQNDGKGRRRNKKKHSNRNEDDEDEANKEPVLDKLVKDIRQKVKDSKKFWSNLPNHICDNDDIAAPSNTDKPCWNGHTVERYKYSITADQTTNADFHVTQTTSRHVANQLYYLKTAISNLKNAYNGMDVEWSDQDEPYYGSGSGSGEGIDEEEGSGSGLSAFEDTQTNDPIHMETPSVRVHTQNISSTTSGTVYTPSHETTGTDKTSSKASRMSLRQAIITYLFPIYILWFGGIISDLL